MEVHVKIDNQAYVARLEENETVQGFLELLPCNFMMLELNGNEKYVYLDNALTSNPIVPKQINAGDIMLYGDNCLVIFYKSFSTTYPYTKIGHVDNLPSLGPQDTQIAISTAEIS